MQGEVVFRGYVGWTVNEDSMEVLDIPNFGIGTEDKYLLSVRNGSSVVGLTVNVGNMVPCYSDANSPTGVVACTMNNTPNTVTAAAHGLKVGDAIKFSATAGGVTAGTLYYVIAVSDANTFQFATGRGGSAFEITADIANTFQIAEEFFALTTFDVPAFAAESTTAPVAGLVSKIVEGWAGGRLMIEKSAATAAAFNAYVEVRRI